MTPEAQNLSQAGRIALARRDGAALARAARALIKLDKANPEGYFLRGQFAKASADIKAARRDFKKAFTLDAGRYDAAIELAELEFQSGNNALAASLISGAQDHMQKSPLYLNMAGQTLVKMGLHMRALPMFEAAHALQVGADSIKSNLASCAADMGQLETAKALYKDLLERAPLHQRHHFELARLQKAQDRTHIAQMETLLSKSNQPDSANIFLMFALAKACEDLGDWDVAFGYLKRANAAAAQGSVQAGYRVQSDLDILEHSYQHSPKPSNTARAYSPSALFITGLPRTGTTLVDRILASHSKVESLGESFLIESAIRGAAGQGANDPISPKMLSSIENPAALMRDYHADIAYKQTGANIFIEKYPLNSQYLGLIAAGDPSAKIVILDRKPMDACFAMFKQPYFRFSYDLDWLADYYIAYDKLRRHWQATLGDRLVSVSYEDLVHAPEAQIRRLLDNLGLEFEPACLEFYKTKGAAASASFAQVRSRAHTGSVNKWLNLADKLAPLKTRLDAAGIETEPYKAHDFNR